MSNADIGEPESPLACACIVDRAESRASRFKSYLRTVMVWTSLRFTGSGRDGDRQRDAAGVLPTGSLLVRAPFASVDSSGRDHDKHLPTRTHATPADGGNVDGQQPETRKNAAANFGSGEPVSSVHGVPVKRCMDSQHSTNGLGVRLAGETRPGGELAVARDNRWHCDLDQGSMSESEGSTLPPPYSAHFVEMWCVCFHRAHYVVV